MDLARWSAATETFLRRLLRLSGEQGVRAAINLVTPVIAVGAPAHAFFPAAAAALDARLVIPEHAEVANAFGAVTSRVVERCASRQAGRFRCCRRRRAAHFRYAG